MANLRKQVDMPNPTCAFPDCGKASITPVIIYCTGHYAQQQKGQALRPIHRTPEGRFWAKVRKTDSCWLWEGAKRQEGYGAFYFEGKLRGAHRFAWQMENGTLSPDLQIDHLCHVPSCVRPSHLRAVPLAGNMQNRRGARSGSRSGVRGVVSHQDAWQVIVTVNGERHHGGTFQRVEDAGRVAQDLRRKLMPYSLMDQKPS